MTISERSPRSTIPKRQYRRTASAHDRPPPPQPAPVFQTCFVRTLYLILHLHMCSRPGSSGPSSLYTCFAGVRRQTSH
ncbi:unnamed protein product [Arctogadus glacialis]